MLREDAVVAQTSLLLYSSTSHLRVSMCTMPAGSTETHAKWSVHVFASALRPTIGCCSVGAALKQQLLSVVSMLHHLCRTHRLRCCSVIIYKLKLMLVDAYRRDSGLPPF
jgi:hypothetical protein